MLKSYVVAEMHIFAELRSLRQGPRRHCSQPKEHVEHQPTNCASRAILTFGISAEPHCDQSGTHHRQGKVSE